MRDRLAFLHLPKSAGTSYRAAIAAHFDPADRATWTFDHWSFGMHPAIPDVRQPILLDHHADDIDLGAFRYLEGHFALDTILAGFDPADVVCILREPRARFLSHYTFWRSWGDELRDQWLPYDVPREARRPLAEYCRSPVAAHQADNLVVRLLAGPHPKIPLDGPIGTDDGPALAERAVERLDSLGFVDVLERGDAVLESLEAWFGSPLSRERLNETDLLGGPPVEVDELQDPTVLALIEDRTRLDQIVWRHAAARSGLLDLDQAADRSLRRSIDRITAATIARITPPATDLPMAERPPARQRLTALVRRGPRAVFERVVAEIRHRTGRSTG